MALTAGTVATKFASVTPCPKGNRVRGASSCRGISPAPDQRVTTWLRGLPSSEGSRLVITSSDPLASSSDPTAATSSSATSSSGHSDFEHLYQILESKLRVQVPVRREQWHKLFELLETGEQAERSLQLMLADAAVKDQLDWDWESQGYGQTLFALVQAAAGVEAYIGEQVLQHAPALHMTVSKDFIPNMMRKTMSQGTPIKPLERLVQLERQLRGRYTYETLYQLSRAYRRRKMRDAVQLLRDRLVGENIEVKEGFVQELDEWLGRGSK